MWLCIEEMDEWIKDNNPSWGSGWGEGDIMVQGS